jgi:uncharacterized membrane protein YraQ (UPF0718 family)
MIIIVTTALLWTMAIGLGVTLMVRSPGRMKLSLKNAAHQGALTFTLIPMALLTASFLSEIMPAQLISSGIGEETGFWGILIATAAGSVMPGGPSLTFPAAVFFLKSGAGTPQIIAFLTSWSVFALHRMLGYEIPLMGWRFSALRLTSAAILPIVAGLLAMALVEIWPRPIVMP